MLRDRKLLLPDKELDFTITECSVQDPYDEKWKVLNRGEEAERRNNIRGQILSSSRPGMRQERTSFGGEHVVECYIVKDGIVIARNALNVPISTDVDENRRRAESLSLRLTSCTSEVQTPQVSSRPVPLGR